MKYLKFSIFLILSTSGTISFAQNVENEDRLCDNVCLTPGCVTAAANLIKTIDPEVNPCDNFYHFACGKYLKEAQVPDDETQLRFDDTVERKPSEKLKILIEQSLNSSEPRPFTLLKQLYKMCMNANEVEENNLAHFEEILSGLGGWPILEGDNWNKDQFNWIDSVSKLRKLGYQPNYFIEFSIGSDSKNSTRRVITVDQASLALPQEILQKGRTDTIAKAYYDYMVEVGVIFGASKTVALKELKESFEFEIKLAKISLSKEKMNVTARYNPMTIHELKEKYASIEWKQYINNMLDIPGLTVEDEELVIVNVPQFITDLEELLRTTPKRVQANYAIWRAVDFSIPYLTEELRRKKFQLDKVLNGNEVQSRSTQCTDVVSNTMPLAASSLYIRYYSNDQIREKVRTIVSDIRSKFRDILKNIDWVDEVTRRNSLEKLESILALVGYSDDIIDNTELEKYYSGIQLNTTNYLMSVLNLSLFEINNSFRKLRQPVNRTEWDMEMPPITHNAMYVPEKNIIEIPAGILQGLMFNNDRPQYMNYASIGFVIGHELTHGFDNDGKNYDKNGNLVDWWSKEANDGFLNKTQCMIDQYSNFTVPELNLNVNGKLTLGENIADNGGIKEAYLAYKEWVKRNGPELPLPGLNYTTNQLFWISTANSWCKKWQPESLKLLILTDEHSPNEFRIRGPFSNSVYFADDFSCPLGTKMNPVNKCHVW